MSYTNINMMEKNSRDQLAHTKYIDHTYFKNMSRNMQLTDIIGVKLISFVHIEGRSLYDVSIF